MKRFAVAVAVLLLAAPLFAETERVLLPVFSLPVFGAHGSRFHTELYIGNAGTTPVTIRNIELACMIVCAPPTFPEGPYELQPGEQLQPGDFIPTGNPGRFMVLDGEDVDAISMNLRVRNISENAVDYGAEIPVVRESEFRINEIAFYGVPSDPNFRNMLRVYSTAPVDVLITVENESIHDPLPVRVRLTGATDMLDPAYGVFTAFPQQVGAVKVRIVADPDFVSLLPVEVPLWAFITVTNNTTNAISTITPQP
ncbi:MAG: hypothetical protein ACJ74H_13630 [Thermoanaerobaculia bacterium]